MSFLRPNTEVYPLLFQKILSFLHQRYLVLRRTSLVLNNIAYFAVPKGSADIRSVFNGTSCGFNDVIFAPNFLPPMSSSMTRSLSFNYKVVDIDLGEMFLNFPGHPSLQPLSGVYITPFKEDLIKHTIQRRNLLWKTIALWQCGHAHGWVFALALSGQPATITWLKN